MPIKEAVKIILAKTDKSLTEVVRLLNEKHGREDSVQNLSKKVNKGTLRYQEAEEIAEILGYEIIWQKKS